MEQLSSKINEGSFLGRIVNGIAKEFPNHRPFLLRRFGKIESDELNFCEQTAEQIHKIAGSRLQEFLAGYEFICNIQKDEELYFRRNGRYRLTTFAEALSEVYDNKPYMLAYMRGLLVTQVLWSNHTKSLQFYSQRYLKLLKNEDKLLEIGPGHGLLMARAIEHLSDFAVTGWDISEASLRDTTDALDALGVTKKYQLQARNLFEVADERFDAVVFSEVLEHLEEPEKAVKAIVNIMRPGGKLYVNVPINSPAPDHLFLLQSPEHVESFLFGCGLNIVESAYYPATNYTLEQAIKHKLTISACLICTPSR